MAKKERGADYKVLYAFTNFTHPDTNAATAQLKAAGTVVGIELLDHIIFNKTSYYSFLEAGRL